MYKPKNFFKDKLLNRIKAVVTTDDVKDLKISDDKAIEVIFKIANSESNESYYNGNSKGKQQGRLEVKDNLKSVLTALGMKQGSNFADATKFAEGIIAEIDSIYK